jgi:hypothetical protein
MATKYVLSGKSGKLVRRQFAIKQLLISSSFFNGKNGY